MLNESLINLLKRQLDHQFRLEALARGSSSSNGCKICHAKDHMGNDSPRYATFRPKCQKCGGLHKTGNCGLRCVFFTKDLGIQKSDVRKKRIPNLVWPPTIIWRCWLMMEKMWKFNLIRIRYLKTTMIHFCTLGFLCSGYIWTHLLDKHKIQCLPTKKWDGGEK
jgi:hypothetical protein